MDIGVGRVLSRLPRKSCWGSGWLKTYLWRLTVIMIEDLGVLGGLLFDNCGCSLCRRSDRISETRAQARADMMVFLVITFPDEVDASTFDKLSSLFVSRVKRLEVTGGDRISVERGTDPAVETIPAPVPGIVRKLGKCAKCKSGGRNKRLRPKPSRHCHDLASCS
jgi:hypothetical protein